MTQFLLHQYTRRRNAQRSSYGLILDSRCLPRKEVGRLRDQGGLQQLMVELTNPYATPSECGYTCFSDIIQDSEELKAMELFSLSGCQWPHPSQACSVPHGLIHALTSRNLSQVFLSNVHLPCSELAGFLLWSSVEKLRLSCVTYTKNPTGAALRSSKKLKQLELSEVPHSLVEELVSGIHNHTPGFHLKVSPDGPNRRFSPELWRAIYPWRVIYPSNSERPTRPFHASQNITSLTLSGAPVFSEASHIFDDLLHESNVVYFGLEDAHFDEPDLKAFLNYVSSDESHLRSLRLRYWNTEISANARNGSEFARLMSALTASRVKEYIHEGISCSMAAVVAHHLPSLGLSACHLEVTRPPVGRRSSPGLSASPADELVAAATSDRTLGVFDKKEFYENTALGSPNRRWFPAFNETVLFPYNKEPQLVGLSVVGIEGRAYGDIGVSPGYWEVFSEDQVDTLYRLVRRNKLLAGIDDDWHKPAARESMSAAQKVAAAMNKPSFVENMDDSAQKEFALWTAAVDQRKNYFEDYKKSAETNDGVWSLQSPASTASMSSDQCTDSEPDAVSQFSTERSKGPTGERASPRRVGTNIYGKRPANSL